MNTLRRWTLAGTIGLLSSTFAWSAEPAQLPPMKKQPTPEQVLAEHLDAV